MTESDGCAAADEPSSQVAADGETIEWGALELETVARLTPELGTEAATREARWLLEEVTGTEGSEWQAIRRAPATVKGVAHLDHLVGRRLSGCPIQYVLGHWPFRELDLLVDERVLIPRPETEVLVGVALEAFDELAPDPVGRVAVDLGCGSGAIGLSLVVERPGLNVILTDVSDDAIAVTRANLAGVGRAGRHATVASGSWFEALDTALIGRIDLLVANPPYIPTGDHLDRAVADWEPASALFSGPDGTDDLSRLIADVRRWMAPESVVVFEMDPRQIVWAMDALTSAGFDRVEAWADLAGQTRGVVVRGR